MEENTINKEPDERINNFMNKIIQDLREAKLLESL